MPQQFDEANIIPLEDVGLTMTGQAPWSGGSGQPTEGLHKASFQKLQCFWNVKEKISTIAVFDIMGFERWIYVNLPTQWAKDNNLDVESYEGSTKGMLVARGIDPEWVEEMAGDDMTALYIEEIMLDEGGEYAPDQDWTWVYYWPAPAGVKGAKSEEQFVSPEVAEKILAGEVTPTPTPRYSKQTEEPAAKPERRAPPSRGGSTARRGPPKRTATDDAPTEAEPPGGEDASAARSRAATRLGGGKRRGPPKPPGRR